MYKRYVVRQIIISGIYQRFPNISPDSAQILIHAFFSSKLDYCNSRLYGIPKDLVKKHVFNMLFISSLTFLPPPRHLSPTYHFP